MDFRKSQDNLRLMIINSVEKKKSLKLLYRKAQTSLHRTCWFVSCFAFVLPKLIVFEDFLHSQTSTWDFLSAVVRSQAAWSTELQEGVFGALLIVWNLQQFTATGQEELWLNDCRQSWCAVCRNSRIVLCIQCITGYMHVSHTFCFKSTSHMSL